MANKGDLVTAIAAKTNLPKARITAVVEALTDSVTEFLANGDEVSLAGFGKFSARQRKERTAKNPRTGEPVAVPATLSPVFRAGKNLKQSVNGGDF